MAAKQRSAKAAKKTASPRTTGGSVAVRSAKKAAKKATPRAAAAAPVRSKPAAKKTAKVASVRRVAVEAPAARVATKPTATRRPATAALRAAQKTPAKAAAAAATSTLQAGDAAPPFELPDQQGEVLSSTSLAGQPYVLYFYPKDDTPGCTTEACGFRDVYPELESTGLRVIGVSPDSVASHQKFVGKYGLPFTLLSDASRELAMAYGVWALKKNYGREFMGIVRSTFLVDRQGVVRKVWRGVRVNGHVADVQAAAAELN